MMRFVSTALIISVSLFPMSSAYSQQPEANTAQSSAYTSLTVPAGAIVPLTLVNPIRNKSSKPGDAIRAVVAFPVTVGTHLAIPAGTYVEGTLGPNPPKSKKQPSPSVQIHFTRLVFANGYTPVIDGQQARTHRPSMPMQPAVYSPNTSFASHPHLLLASAPIGEGQATQPTLPPLPSIGPNPAVITGVVLGVGVGISAVAIIMAHHKAGNTDSVLYDAGWQFQMKLESPLVLDAARIDANAGISK